MSTEKTEAVVIRLVDFSETSRVVTFFTRDFGKVAVLAKGAKRLKGPFDAALDLLSICRIVFICKSSSTLGILTEAKLNSRFRPTGRDLTGLYGGYYVAELLDGLTENDDPHPELYTAALTALTTLAAGEQCFLAVVRYELALLREIGQLPNFDDCVSCGAAIAANGPFAYWVSQGGLICRDCQKQEYVNNRIQPGTVAVLRQLASVEEMLFPRLDVSKQQLNEMRRLLSSAIAACLGRRPKTARYLDAGLRNSS